MASRPECEVCGERITLSCANHTLPLFKQVEDDGNPFMKPHGAFKDGKLVAAWKIAPDAWDLVDLDYDFTRPLSAAEVEEVTA